MILFFQPLLEKDHDKHGCHDEIESLGVKMDQGTKDPAQSSAEKPVKMVERGDEKHEPAFVDVFWDHGSVIDRKALVTHSEDEIKGTPSVSPVFFQHGDAVEQMPGIDHKCHGKCLQRVKCPEQEIYSDELHASGKDCDAHEHGIDKGKAGYIHIDAICKPQKPETCEDGYRMGKSGPEGPVDLPVFRDLKLFSCHK